MVRSSYKAFVLSSVEIPEDLWRMKTRNALANHIKRYWYL